MKKIILLPILMVLIFAACKKDVKPVDLKTEYFPLKIGSWIIYNVDSTYYDNFTLKSYTHHFQLKEMITASFIDGSGDVAYRLERFERDYDSLPFQIKNVWTEKIINNRAERVEENLRFIKLVFPPQISVTWKGNVFIKPDLTSVYTKYLGNWDYEYTSIDAFKAYGNNNFNATATVLAFDENVPGLQQTSFVETYAKGVGLIYYHHKFVEKQPTDATWISGFDVTATVSSYGN